MADSLVVEITRLAHGRDLPLPDRGSRQAAGWDLRAAVESEVVIPACSTAAVPTGIKLAIPPGWEGQVRPRSGLAARLAVTLTNSPGTVDSDYRGEVKVLMINHGAEPVTIRRGDRIAQLLFAPVPEVEWREVGEVEGTERGDGGFGSSGE